jgi:hypothetical protein
LPVADDADHDRGVARLRMILLAERVLSLVEPVDEGLVDDDHFLGVA